MEYKDLKALFIVFLVLTFSQVSYCQSSVNSSKTTVIKSKKIEKQDKRDKIRKDMQGIWIHTEDKSATVEISGTTWFFKYVDSKTTDDDKYNIAIDFKLPQFVDTTEKADFIILTNKSDTLFYELLGFTKKTMSLMHYPSAKLHLYRKK